MYVDQNTPHAELVSFVTFRLARTQNKLNAQATALLKAHSELSLVEWRIIMLVRLYDGASMSKIAGDVQMDKGQLSRKVAAMTAKGLIQTTPDDHDHRMQHLHLTPKALELAETMTPVMRKRQARLVDGVEPDELEVFLKVLARIDEAAEARDIE